MIGTLLGNPSHQRSDDHYTSEKQRERTELSKLTKGVIVYLPSRGNRNYLSIKGRVAHATRDG